MKVKSIRFCQVSEQAEALANFLGHLGVKEDKSLRCTKNDGSFSGAIFPAGDSEERSWIEIWPSSEQMPASTMLQIVVDNSDEFAAHAKSNGITLHGPMDDHGERIYFTQGPDGLPISIQSKI